MFGDVSKSCYMTCINPSYIIICQLWSSMRAFVERTSVWRPLVKGPRNEGLWKYRVYLSFFGPESYVRQPSWLDLGRFGLALAGGSGVAEAVSEGLRLRPGALSWQVKAWRAYIPSFSSGQKVTSGSRRGWTGDVLGSRWQGDLV